MAIIHRYFAYCDVEGCAFHNEAGTDEHSTIRELRDAMKRDGWKRTDGKDLCSDCVNERKVTS